MLTYLSTAIGSVLRLSSTMRASCKAKDYIIENVNNLLNQTLAGTEIVIVNDCSPDDSMELCRKHFGDNERVQLIDQPQNMGPGAARNRGIEAARGEYITFVDSDDGVLPDAYEKMYNAAKANDADVLHVTGSILPLVKNAPADLLKVGKEDWFSRNMDHFNQTSVLRVITDDPRERFENWKKGTYHWSVWSKLYRREMMLKYNIYNYGYADCKQEKRRNEAHRGACRTC